jgi:hypothetical protein
MKETIPRQNAIEAAIQTQRPHVRNDPLYVRKTFLAHANHDRR